MCVCMYKTFFSLIVNAHHQFNYHIASFTYVANISGMYFTYTCVHTVWFLLKEFTFTIYTENINTSI